MSPQILDVTFVVILLLDFYILAAGRLPAVIVAAAVQGVVLALIFPIAHIGPSSPLSSSPATSFWAEARLILLAAVMALTKGFIIPWMLFRAMRKAVIDPQVNSIIGLLPTLFLGALAAGLAMALSDRMPLRTDHAVPLLVPTSLATFFAGFLLLTTRRTAISQVIGYIVLENGIFIFGLLLVDAIPDIVEIGVLLDLFVGVFVMGIIIHHVSRAFPTATTEYMSALRE